MHGWWILMGATTAIGLAVLSRLRRHHRRRAQVDRVRTALSTWLPALKQPDDTTVLEPPTEDNLTPSVSPRQTAPTGCAVRPRRTLMFGDLGLDGTVGSRRVA
jgi:hypothetical protein